MYAPAIVVTSLAFVSLLLLKKIEIRLRRDTYLAVMIWSADLGGQLEKIEQIMETCEVELLNSAIERDLEKRSVYFEFQVMSRARKLACDLVDRVAAIEGVRKVRIE